MKAPKRNPFVAVRDKVQLLGTQGLFTYLGVLIVAAIYYILFEIWPPATRAWHNAVPDSELRHNIRDVGEGLIGGLLAHAIAWNHFKKTVSKKPNLLDRVEIKLHIPNLRDSRGGSLGQLAMVLPLVLLYAAPGFFLAQWVVGLIHFNVPAYVEHSSVAGKLWAVVTDNYPKKLIGFGASFLFGRRPALAVFDDLQLWFAERKVLRGRPPRFYYPPTFKARYNSVLAQGCVGVASHGKLQTFLTVGALALGAGLAGFGFYVLTYIA